MSRVSFVGLLTLLSLSTPVRGGTVPEPSLDAPAALTVSVTETPDAVRLRVEVLGEIEPGSLEIGFDGRKVIVSARNAEGRPIRARAVDLPAAVVEDGASAEADGDDALAITLRKRRTAAAAQVDPEPLAR
jgi:HSP20 family molecular chaperone IbpA